MTEQRWGVTIPLMGVSLAEHRRYLEEIAELGLTDVWSSEAGAHDAFTPLVVMGLEDYGFGAFPRIRVPKDTPL